MIRNKRYDPRDTKHQVKFDVLIYTDVIKEKYTFIKI